jgi:flagellar hook assembly protein FlgD
LRIFDNVGLLVFSKILDNQNAGMNTYTWNGAGNDRKPLLGGLYHCLVTHNNKSLSEKIIILK